MTKTYSMNMNIKNWIAFIALLISIPFLYIKLIGCVIGLVLTTILFDGFVQSDVVVLKKDKLYIITKRENSLWNLIGFLLIFIAFVLIIGHFYFYGLILFYVVYLYIFGRNIYKSKELKNFDVEDIFEHRNFHYFVYEVVKVYDYDQNRFELDLVDHFDSSNKINLVFFVSKMFNPYKEVYRLFESRMK